MLVTSASSGTLFLFAVTAVNLTNGVLTVMLLVIAGMNSHVIGELANVLMACVKLVSMVTLAVTNVSLDYMVSIVKMSVEAV